MPGQGQNIDLKQFIGGMDTDSPNESIGKGYVRGAYDIIWRGPVGNRRPESNYGTNLIPNALLPNTGTHLTIHAMYDAVYKRVFFWNYNSAGRHAIYVYNTAAQPVATFQLLIQTGINTVGDPLGFTPTGRISSADILYADAPIGPILFYVDSLGRPTQININRYLAGTYTGITRSYIDVIKAPPVMPPQVTYEADYTVTANNTINSLFQFGYSFFFDNNEESVLSSRSIVALPQNAFNPQVYVPVTQDARIAMYVQTGDPTVQKIRLYGRQTKDGATTDWFIIDTLIKSQLSIANNTTYRYLFYNTGNYVAADPKFTVLGQDLCPQSCNCQAILDGNTPAYAGITEGYNFFNPTFSFDIVNQIPPLYVLNGTLYFAATNGIFTGSQPHILLTLTGEGTSNDAFGNPQNLNIPPQNLYLRAKSSGTDISFSINSQVSNSIPTLLSHLATAATAAGWTVVATNPLSIEIYYPTGNVVLQSSYLLNSQTIMNTTTTQLASCPQAAYQYGVVYYDAYGRTNGVISNVGGEINTLASLANSYMLPLITLNLSGFIPPSWAVYYHVVRTDNLTYNKRLDWVTCQSFSNVGQSPTNQYAYLGISNIYDYNQIIGATEGVVSYGFAQGDRVRIVGVYSVEGAFTQLNFDFALLGVAVNPIINGVVQIGTFLQIEYPSYAVPPLDFTGNPDFQNYQILIYSYKGYSANNQNVFFEIGQQYGIGNPGTNTAYHMGNDADNVVAISDGDLFYRERNVYTGATYYVNVEDTAFSNQWATLNTLNDQGIITTSLYTISQQEGFSASPAFGLYPQYHDDKYIFFGTGTSGSQAYQLRFRGTYNVSGDKALTHKLFAKVVTATGATITYLLKTLWVAQPNTVAGGTYTVTFDQTVSVPSAGKAWLIAENDSSSGVSNIFIGAFQLRMDVINWITIQIFESSFSDIFKLVTNSDNRPSVIDTTALQAFYPTLFRYAEPYVPGTNIYQANRFYDANLDEFEASHGQVQRMVQWQRRLRVAQERKWGEVGVYAKFIKNNSGTAELIVNDLIIEQNNIQYFDGDFGIGNQRDGLAINGFQIWFPDPVRGAFCRLSLDGIKQISEEFMVQTFAGSLTPGYLNNYAYPYGGNAVMLGCYNFSKDRFAESLFCFQPGTLGGVTLPAQSIAFIEKTNVFSSYYTFAPDAIVCAENQLISFSQGQLYVHNDTGPTRSYYGTPFIPQLDIIFNDQEAIRKTFQALSYQPFNNKLWTAKNVGDINTSLYNPQTGLQQISQLIAPDMEIVEGQANAAFLRDANSGLNPAIAINEGDYLKGYWIRVLLTAPDSGFNALFAPFVRWESSMKTP